MVKVDAKKFKDSVDYIKLINATPLNDLDLSEYCKHFSSAELTRLKVNWEMTGLNNRDFLLLYGAIDDNQS